MPREITAGTVLPIVVVRAFGITAAPEHMKESYEAVAREGIDLSRERDVGRNVPLELFD